MYDMYDWSAPEFPADDVSGKGSSAFKPSSAGATPSRRSRARTHHPFAARAVQVALDRRDNGGDASPEA